MWKNTQKCIEIIENLVLCKLCHRTVNNPQGLGNCEHFFCSDCITRHIGNTCPVCCLPSYAMDVHPNHRIAGFVQQFCLLKQFLNEFSEHNDANCIEIIDTGEKASTVNDLSPQIISGVDDVLQLSTPSIQDNRTSQSKANHCTPTMTPSSVKNAESILTISSVTDLKKSRVKNQTIESPSTLSKTSNKSPEVVFQEKRINRRNAKGETPLHLAVIKRDVAKVIGLLEQGANPNVKDHAGWTPLHEACNVGSLEIVTLLLDAGSKINTPGFNNMTPLQDAVECGRVDIVKLLLTRGADPTRRNVHGQTAVDLAKDDSIKSMLTSMSVKSDCSVKSDDIDDLRNSKPLVFFYTGLNAKQKDMLIECAKMLNAKVADEFSPAVTHLIAANSPQGTCPRTLKFLLCIMTGKWIVRFKWIEDLLKTKTPIPENKYEVNGTNSQPNCHGPKKARQNMQQQNPGLFSGCHFYFHGNFTSPYPTKEDLVKLVQLGDGIVLCREPKPDTIDEHDLTTPFHTNSKSRSFAKCSHFIIYQNIVKTSIKYNSKYLKSLPVAWLLECISKFEILEETP